MPRDTGLGDLVAAEQHDLAQTFRRMPGGLARGSAAGRSAAAARHYGPSSSASSAYEALARGAGGFGP